MALLVGVEKAEQSSKQEMADDILTYKFGLKYTFD
jgi:hypothetical protein